MSAVRLDDCRRVSQLFVPGGAHSSALRCGFPSAIHACLELVDCPSRARGIPDGSIDAREAGKGRSLQHASSKCGFEEVGRFKLEELDRNGGNAATSV